jgi:multidrug efflux pump
VEVRFRGQAEEQAEAQGFLLRGLPAVDLPDAADPGYPVQQPLPGRLVLSAIVFSTAGVLLGLLLRQEPFSIVMSGIGVIALAGIVVNNNIVLIDTYNVLRRQGSNRSTPRCAPAPSACARCC